MDLPSRFLPTSAQNITSILVCYGTLFIVDRGNQDYCVPVFQGQKTGKSPVEGGFTGVEEPQNVDGVPLPDAGKRRSRAGYEAIS